MKYCDGDRKCTYIGFNRQCLASTSYACEHKITIWDHEAGRVIEVPDLDSVKCAMPPTDLSRIADALERIAKELEKANRLKALSFRKDSYVELDEVDEIMED